MTAVGGTSLASSRHGGCTETRLERRGQRLQRLGRSRVADRHGCAKRTVADVSAVADPNTGVGVYDTYGGNGWFVFGGTSVASPIVGVDVRAGATRGHDEPARELPVRARPSASQRRDGREQRQLRRSYLCTAVVGYDGPTGLGTPNGVAAFTSAPAVRRLLARPRRPAV